MATLPKSGDKLLDRYRVKRPLAEGGMGLVVLAHDERLDRPVALKFLRPELVQVRGIAERFQREARTLCQLRSTHVVRVFDVHETDDGLPFVAMEYLEGADLSDELSRRGPLPPTEAARVVVDVCHALSEAHGRGVIHRDIKPSNLFRARDGGRSVIKVLDFGIAKDLSRAHEAKLTRTGAMLGSPAYMSPEQIRSEASVDARTDVWALGATLYELLAGRPPFEGDAITLPLAIGTTNPVPITRPDVPPGLAEIVLRALEKEPARRYQTVLEMARALAPFAGSDASVSFTNEADAHGLPLSPTVVTGASARSAPASLQGLTAVGERSRRRSVTTGVVLALVVAGLGVASFWHLRTRDREGASRAVVAPESAASVAPSTPAARVVELPAATASAAASVEPSPSASTSASARAPSAGRDAAPSKSTRGSGRRSPNAAGSASPSQVGAAPIFYPGQ